MKLNSLSFADADLLHQKVLAIGLDHVADAEWDRVVIQTSRDNRLFIKFMSEGGKKDEDAGRRLYHHLNEYGVSCFHPEGELRKLIVDEESFVGHFLGAKGEQHG